MKNEWTTAAVLGAVMTLGWFAFSAIQAKLDVVREGVRMDVTTAMKPIMDEQQALGEQVRSISESVQKLEAERRPKWPRTEEQP